MVGKIVGNRYRIGDRLGGGGMAVVYKAQDMQLGRDVAVKVLRGQFGTDEDFIRRFRREAQNAASLSHPNVVQIYDVGQDEDLYYIVLELVEGRSLKEVIQQQGPLPVAEVARIAMEILGALSHAHHHRIVHRDVKPHNILIARDGRVKVTDFGIARATTTDTVTHTGSIMGSAHYFSPEQADGRPTGEKSDIYSLGVVLYEMVTGTVPFQGESPITVAIKHLRDQVIPPSRLNSEVPVELEEIILRALEKDPADRFGSADAMREALRGFAEAHAAGRTHIPSGDFPTMDLRSMRTRKVRRQLEEPDAEEDDDSIPTRLRQARARENERHRRSSGWVWVVVVALIVFGGIGAATWAVIDYMDVPDVTVPDVRGRSRKDAEQMLKSAQLDYVTQSEPYSDMKQGTIIDTDPAPGTPVKPGRDIGLIISRGPDAEKVPDLKNRTLQDARTDLENRRLVVGSVDYVDSPTVEAGRVVDTTPAAGIDLKPGSSVNLRISRGPLMVPNLVGKSVADARRDLESLGLVVAPPEYRPHPTLPKDRVMQTDPPAGTRVTPGQAVKLILSQGPTAEGKPFAKVLTVPCPAGQFCDFKVTLLDIVGGVPSETVLLSEKRKDGEKVTIKGTFYGNAVLIVAVEGAEQQRVPLP